MEDILTDTINVQARSAFKIAQSIANAIDLKIYNDLTTKTGTAGTVSAVAPWDASAEASRKPIEDILRGIQKITENNYDAKAGGVLLVNPHDYASLMMNSKVINNPSFKTADVVSNGVVGQIAGLTIVESTTVTDDEAMIIIRSRTATWMSVVGLTSAIIIKPGISTTIRSWEIGLMKITDPLTIYTIEGTEE